MVHYYRTKPILSETSQRLLTYQLEEGRRHLRHLTGMMRQLFVGKQILIIDDQNQLLSLMRRILEDEQYQVHILQNGKDAFSHMKALLPDLLILDLKLGEVSG